MQFWWWLLPMKLWTKTDLAVRNGFFSAVGKGLITAVALGAMLNFITPSNALAQFGNVGQPGVGHHAPAPTAEPDRPALPPPEAVPGAKPRAPAAPATHAASDLQPTDALFDAINRGDIAAARDALNRGADMDGVNVLGMTPMELSVDLGRNDISFLLLSMRGEDSGRGSRAMSRDAAGSVPATKGAGQASGRAKASAAAKPAGRTKVVEKPATPKPITKPKLFANDGGAPLPSAGFLGFDPRSATN
jgi:hypothetical protein